MTTQYIQFNLDRNNTYISSFVDLNNKQFFTFTIRWVEDYDYFLLNIQDIDGNYIVAGESLVNNLIIRNAKLPYVFIFAHLNGETYEPTIDCIKEFGLVYETDD